MKELDLLLGRFVDLQQTALSAGAWPQLESMLAAEDDLLWDWLQDPTSAADSKLHELLEAIRDEHATPH